MVKIVDLEHKWALSIGRMFVAFGSIESCTYKCLEAFIEESIVTHFKSMPLSKRIDVLIDLVTPKKLEINNKEEFLSNLKQIKILSKKRNLIAHNPLVLQLFDDQTKQNVWKERIVPLKKSTQAIEYDEVVLLSEEAESLSSALHANMAKFRSEGIHT